MGIFIKWLISAAAILLVSYVLPGVEVAGFWAALWVALFLALVNTVIRPLLVLLTLPINILTLGLFTLVINALLVMLASSVLDGFAVSGFMAAFWFALVLALFNYLLNLLFKGDK